MRPFTIGLADTAPAHPATLARVQAAARTAGFDGDLLHLDIPAQAAQLALCNSVLLIGLAKGAEAAMAEHMRFREALSQAGLPYQVIYGLDETQLAERMAFMQGQQVPASGGAWPGGKPASPRAQWVWPCDKCSDPQCEHRLLTDLIRQRRSAA